MKVSIRIIGRGEEIEYTFGERHLCADMTFMNGLRFFPASVEKWNDGTELTEDERTMVFIDVVDFLIGNEPNPIIVINTNDEKMSLWSSLCNERKLEIEWTSNLEVEK